MGNGGWSGNWSSGKGNGDDNGDSSAGDGVELNFVCGGVPVLTLDKSSVFHENASWMLQSALSSSGKADSLYQYCEDEDIQWECRRLGLRDEDLSLVRLRQQGLSHVKAVGTTGKRSVMLAVVVALALEDGDALDGLWKELKDYKLDGHFVDLLRSGRQTLSGDQDGDVSAPAAHGVELSVICGTVPVLGLEKDSVFHENVSWLLQTALSSSGKADSLYEYCDDREILTECRRMGLEDQEVGIVRLRREELRGVRAVGTCGKRSIMLSLVVALAMSGNVQLEAFLRQVGEYDDELERPLRELLRRAMPNGGGWNSSESGQGGDGGDGGDGSDSGYRGNKRKRGWGREGGSSWSQKGYTWSQPSNPAGKKRGGSKQQQPSTNEKSLDKQLEDYWGDDR